MTTYRVSRDGSNTSPYDTWAKAATTLATALTAASSSGDIVLVDKDHYESISATTTWTAANHISIICVDKDNSDALATMDGTNAYFGNTSTSYAVSLAGAYCVYLYGLAFINAGSSNTHININTSDGGDFILESCKIWKKNTSAGAYIYLNGSLNNGYTTLIDCDLWFGADSNVMNRGRVVAYKLTINSGGTIPSPLFNDSTGTSYHFEACDFSNITGTLCASSGGTELPYTFVNCKLNSGVTVLAAQTHTNLSCAEVYMFNCAAGDEHYHLAHYNSLGSTIISTSIYANDGASYDGTNRHSWLVSGTSSALPHRPYLSPWIDCYHSGTSAITPYLEIVRSGSATAYQNDEVWSEWSYQGTSGYPLSVLVNDKVALLGTPADQTTGTLDASGWTGENATSWFGKLSPTSSITPAEIGHLRARVCVGGEYTVYIDPQIRGLS